MKRQDRESQRTREPIGNVVAGQYRLMWATLRDLVRSCPPEQWLSGEEPALVPARQAYHILGGAEWCCDEDRFEATNPFGLKLAINLFDADLPSDRWPSRERMLTMIDDVEARIEQRLAHLTDAALLERTGVEFPPSAKSLGQYTYMLRHCQQHVGEMKAEHRRRGLPLPEWR